tara:strand:+ start:28455 stop:29177 length:723 start_codon:yes stop_codon:yes gene_type:complete
VSNKYRFICRAAVLTLSVIAITGDSNGYQCGEISMNNEQKKPTGLPLAMNIGCEETTLVRLARIDSALGERARCVLIKHHYNWIKQRCLHILANEANAHDAAQDVVILMYRAFPKFEGRSSVRTWLHTIVHNQCVSQIRKRQRSEMTGQQEAVITLYEMDQRHLSGLADLTIDDVRNALANLPLQVSEILQLRFFSEMSLEEISVVLGIGLSACKMRLYRAIDQFKKIYAHESSEQRLFA